MPQCDLHQTNLPCPWPRCRTAAGIHAYHEGQSARQWLCGACGLEAWVWVLMGNPMPEIGHECEGKTV